MRYVQSMRKERRGIISSIRKHLQYGCKMVNMRITSRTRNAKELQKGLIKGEGYVLH